MKNTRNPRSNEGKKAVLLVVVSVFICILIVFTIGKSVYLFIKENLYDQKDLHQMIGESDKLYERGKYDRAILGYKTALFFDNGDRINNKPVAPFAYIGLLRCYMKKGDRGNISKYLKLYASDCLYEYNLIPLLDGETKEDRSDFLLSLEYIVNDDLDKGREIMLRLSGNKNQPGQIQWKCKQFLEAIDTLSQK